MYLRMSALRIVRMPPRANVSAQHAADECIRRRERLQDGDAAFCQITLDACFLLLARQHKFSYSCFVDVIAELLNILNI